MPAKISRRDFLKIFGTSSLGVALGGLGILSLLKDTSRSNNASAQSYGSWQLGGQTHATPVHVAVLHNSKILYVAGSGFYAQNELGPHQHGIYDCNTNTVESQGTTAEDTFCMGQTQLANGNILLAGGTLTWNTRSANGKWLGLNKAWIFDVPSNTLRPTASMAHGRWYPTLLTLGDGKVLCVAGWDEYGSQNKLAEIFDPATETWSIKYDPQATGGYCVGEGQDPAVMPGAGQPCYGPGVAPNVLLYPRMHLMPSGLVAFCGQTKTLRTFNPATGVWKFAGNMLFGASRGYGTSCLLPLQNTLAEKGAILIFGGTSTDDSFATTTAEILTPSGTALQPRWTASLAFGRKHPIPVIMPDGKILVIGGTTYQNSSANKIMAAELFDPMTETWTTLPAMTVPRMYHSSALLLPDGRVWTGGTTYSVTSRELRVEYFVPYYYSATRPTISGNPIVGSYGETITVPTPEGLDVNSVSLVAMSTETHAHNCNQRLIWLQIQNKTTAQVVVSAPVNSNIAPPGYYYIHVLKDGVPSSASIIKIPGEVLVPPDTTLPVINIVTPTAGQTLTGTDAGLAVSVTGDASDVGSGLQVVEVKVDAGAFIPATGTASWSFTTPTLDGGPHTITARAKDNAGNVSSEATVNFTIEIPPSGGAFVSIYSVVGSNSYGTIFSTGGIAQGESLTPSSSLIGSTIKRVAVILKKTGNPTGLIYVRVRNGSSAIVKEFGTIDTAALTTADKRFEVTAASSYILQANDKVLVEWAGTGNSADVVNVKRTGADAFNGSSTLYVSRNASGSYTTSTTRDLAGDWYYQSSAPADTTPPTIAIDTPTDNQTLTGPSPSFTVNVAGTANDAGSGLELVEVKVDAGAFIPAIGTDSWTFTTPLLTAGPHTITARAKDVAGNTSLEATANIMVEVTSSGVFVKTYSVVGSNSYGTIFSTGSTGDAMAQGEKLLPASTLIGTAVKRVAVVLKKSGNPTGTINIRIRKGSDDSIAMEIGSIDASTLTTADQRYELTASGTHILQANDKVLVEWTGTGNSADIVNVKRTGADAFEGTNAYIVTRKVNGTYTNGTTRDLAGDWYYES
jgi:hypothetical protein